MNDKLSSPQAISMISRDWFGARFDVKTVIASDLDVGSMARATVFLNEKKQLFVYVHGQARLLLKDVKKIISRMGLVAELYFPPKGQPNYFDDIGRAKFREVFPGRDAVSETDLAYYRQLAPYSPALVQIREVKDGHIYQYDSDARGGWRVSAKFAYRRIRTS